MTALENLQQVFDGGKWRNASEYYADQLLQSHAGLITDGHGRETPTRFLAMLDEMTSCRRRPGQETEDDRDKHLKECIKWKTFPSSSDEMVTQLSIPFVSLCNHHVVPFTGVAHIGYVPNGSIVGLSKLARVVRHFARRLQVQEKLTADVADFLQARLEPKGVAVMMKAEHMCMTLRGVQVPGTQTVTSKMTGVFGDHARTAKAEFLAIVNGSH